MRCPRKCPSAASFREEEGRVGCASLRAIVALTTLPRNGFVQQAMYTHNLSSLHSPLIDTNPVRKPIKIANRFWAKEKPSGTVGQTASPTRAKDIAGYENLNQAPAHDLRAGKCLVLLTRSHKRLMLDSFLLDAVISCWVRIRVIARHDAAE